VHKALKEFTNMKMTIYSADCTGNAANCLYPNRHDVTDSRGFTEAVARDHVCAAYRENHRGIGNFISSDVLMMDIDNDHTENAAEWITPEALDALIPDVDYVMVPSRHHMMQKDRYSPRPRYHVYFPIKECSSAAEYAAVKKALFAEMSFFDSGALDAARFSFGCTSPEIEWHEGRMAITDYLDDETIPEQLRDIIPAGSRNNTLSRFAGRVLKRYGITDKARRLFIEEAEKCDPPLEQNELETIWSSACKFAKRIQSQEGYVPPEEYEGNADNCSLEPEDYSDIGQAKVLAREYGNELIYTSATDFLRYDGTVWIEDKQMAVGAVIELLDLQLDEASDELETTKEALVNSGVPKEAIYAGGKALEKCITNDTQRSNLLAYKSALAYYTFIMKRRDMKYITSTMGVAKSLLNSDINAMDPDPNLLNTPCGTYDLKQGISSRRDHEASDLITKITECSPGDNGADIWDEALNTFFCGNKELISYVQRVVGMAAVGQVFQEHLIIAYGDGANGKSTFWNTIARVLGTYSGKISPEVLTVANKRNAKPEMAELKGKRLVIASEMEEGMRLNTSVVKQLCSTDAIQAEKKFEKPFHFTPTHTLVLYTNHLPRVGANDDGIWRRLIVIPFEAKITGKSDIKNYGDYLYENAGPAILGWIIEGARIAVGMGFRWYLPARVQTAVDEYRQQNDWFSIFIEECCEVGEDFTEKSGKLYDEYRSYCTRCGEYTRNSADFYAAVEKAGFKRKRTATGRIISGVRIKSDFLE